MATLGLTGPVLIVAGNSAIRLLSETWRLSLTEAGFAWQVCRFGGECSITEIERVKRQAREQGMRVIVGAGGGKVLDMRAAAADLDLSFQGRAEPLTGGPSWSSTRSSD